MAFNVNDKTFFFFALEVGGVAETVTVTASGVVTDTQGAVVPGATVTVNNTTTEVSGNPKTNETGSFRAARLQPGTYKVNVGGIGFKKPILR